MKTTHCPGHLDAILSNAQAGKTLSAEDIEYLLDIRDAGAREAVFQAARALRRQYFGDGIFLYGFVYISTFCRNNCRFCFFRRANATAGRYRKDPAEIIEASRRLARSGVHLIDLTTGEDPVFFSGGTPGFHQLADLVKTVKSETGLSVMVSPGVVPDTVMADLARAGASWYACYQETHRPELFQALRTGQSYDMRLEKKRLAHRSGMLIEEGILCGIGETHADVARSIAVMRCLDADQVRVMNFVPQPGTPMADCLPSDSRREFMIIAVMRLIFPDRLIPASLDVGGLDGLKQRLDAGANVVTSLVPPGQGLAGVAQSSLDIENARRSTGSVLPVLEACGLRRAGLDEYDTWICGRQRKILKARDQKKIA